MIGMRPTLAEHPRFGSRRAALAPHPFEPSDPRSSSLPQSAVSASTRPSRSGIATRWRVRAIVDVPLGSGVRGLPLGGYAPFAVPASVPVGITGVIRGAVRNSDVFADRSMAFLAIPKDIFLERWHSPYDRRMSEDQARAGLTGSAALAGQSKSIRSARHQKA